VADHCEAFLQVEEGVSRAAGETHCGVEFAATPALRVQPLCVAADISGDGRCRQRRRYPSRDVRGQSARLPGIQFQTAERRRAGHDFLWRTTRRLPERGRIGIFNRSYYEEVLVVRVHPEILRSQGLSEELRDEKTIWEERYCSIVDLESHLYRNGTRTIKIFLHLSQEEQRKRFLERIDEPDKNWKFSLADIHERKYWKDYMRAFEACLNATSSHRAPWYVVPADDKENARLIVSQIVLDALNELKMANPKTTAKRWRELKSIRKLLTK
jgi:PPK2 family polyphosphate:nucleotide phosphotransferase